MHDLHHHQMMSEFGIPDPIGDAYDPPCSVRCEPLSGQQVGQGPAGQHELRCSVLLGLAGIQDDPAQLPLNLVPGLHDARRVSARASAIGSDCRPPSAL